MCIDVSVWWIGQAEVAYNVLDVQVRSMLEQELNHR